MKIYNICNFTELATRSEKRYNTGSHDSSNDNLTLDNDTRLRSTGRAQPRSRRQFIATFKLINTSYNNKKKIKIILEKYSLR